MKRFLKNNIIAGLLVLVPVGLSVFVLAFIIGRLDSLMAPWISSAIVRWRLPIPEDFYLPGLGFILVCLLVFIVGLVATNFFGKKLVGFGERILNETPFVRGIYTTIKKVIDSFSQAEEGAFDKVVLIRYPHTSLQLFGLIAGETRDEAAHHAGEGMINVFIPMIPNVTLGFFIILPKKDITPVDIGVEEAMKYIMSFGLAKGDSVKQEPASS